MKNILIVIVVFLILGGVGYYVIKQLNSQELNPTIIAIQDKGGLVVGTDPTYPPMENLDKSGNFIGFDIDLIKEIAKELGVKVIFKNIAFDSLIDKVMSGDLDMSISSFSITPDRAKKVLFSSPYLNAGQSILVVNTNNNIKSYDDLTGKRLSAQKDTTSEKEALKVTKTVTTYTSDYGSILQQMKQGKIDALIIDLPAAANIVKTIPGFRIVGDPFTNEFYGIVLKKGNEPLQQAVNEALANIKRSGKLTKLENLWLR